MRTLLFLLLTISTALFSADNANEPNRILFLMQAGHVDQALNLYHKHVEKIGHHDQELLRGIGMTVLDQGHRSSEPEIQLLTFFGAGISANESALYILLDGLKNRNPLLQLVAMNFISNYENEEADMAINHALGSSFLLIRLEAAYHLAKKKAPKAVPQTEALMSKVDTELWPVFPQLYAMVGDDQAIRLLRKLLAHPKEAVRIAAILSSAKYGRDDLLPTIRILATHHLSVQQEACAVALGVLKDESSVKKLESIASSSALTTRLAAWQALYSLGHKEVRASIEEAAKQNDLFAIAMLGKIEGSEDLLFSLLQSTNSHVRANATLALLERKDIRCLKPLCDLLIRDSRDLGLQRVASPGGGLIAYKVVPSARQNFDENASAAELSLALREGIVSQAVELPEFTFLTMANAIMELRQNDLIPALVEVLQDLRTPGAIALLKKHQQKAGAPLIRNYCNLALYRLKEEGPYGDNLRAWIAKEQHGELIHFRPLLSFEMRDNKDPGMHSSYQLTPEETSRLLVDSFEAMIQNQDETGLDVLLHAIQYGNAKNKYALAGLLIHAAQ